MLTRTAPEAWSEVFKEAIGEEGAIPTDPPRGGAPLTFKGKFRMQSFADALWTSAGRVSVIDQTGLPGIYDLTLTIDRRGVTGGETQAGRGGDGAGGLRNCNSFSKMLEDQLGLVLQQATVPTQHLVVDQIKKPTEN
jgi:uncharacterized protein (TIGR03435 family)